MHITKLTKSAFRSFRSFHQEFKKPKERPTIDLVQWIVQCNAMDRLRVCIHLSLEKKASWSLHGAEHDPGRRRFTKEYRYRSDYKIP